MIVLLLPLVILCRGEYVEEVVVKPLSGAGRVYSHFQFTNRFALNDDVAPCEEESNYTQNIFNFCLNFPFLKVHFDDFPKSIAQLVTRFQIEEWHISFTRMKL
jgi:hypothetical protein